MRCCSFLLPLSSPLRYLLPSNRPSRPVIWAARPEKVSSQSGGRANSQGRTPPSLLTFLSLYDHAATPSRGSEFGSLRYSPREKNMLCYDIAASRLRVADPALLWARPLLGSSLIHPVELTRGSYLSPFMYGHITSFTRLTTTPLPFP